MLANKALSLGDHIKKTIVSNLLDRATGLRDEYEKAYRLCTETSTEPDRLLQLLALQKTLKGKLREMRLQAEDIDALHQVVVSYSHLLEDEDDFCLFRLKNLAAILPELENQARGVLSEVISPQ